MTDRVYDEDRDAWRDPDTEQLFRHKTGNLLNNGMWLGSDDAEQSAQNMTVAEATEGVAHGGAAINFNAKGKTKQLGTSGMVVPANSPIEMKARLDKSPAPRVTPQRIEDVIHNVKFYHHNLLTICVLDLANGFTVTGESACAAAENYNRVIGEQIAYDMAKQKIWPLEGYLLRQQLHDNVSVDGELQQAPDTHRNVGA